MESDITCFVGNNGTGKSALILALKRIFGSTREERTVIREDFYVGSGEDYKEISGRELYIEIIFSFPELQTAVDESREVCPAFSSVIYADQDDKRLKARMRLESKWDENEYEDEVQSQLYWITTSNKVDFGDDAENKFPVSVYDRKHIKLRYIPAFRDSKSTLKNEVKSLTNLLDGYTDLNISSQEKIEAISRDLSNEIQSLESIKTATSLLKQVWNNTHDKTLKHYQEPKLEAASTEIGELLRTMTVKLSPSEDGGSRDINELSDGQISLLYFTLSVVLYILEQKHHSGELRGFKSLDRDIPVFTIFAFEEPENHLSPFYLGRVIEVLSTQTNSLKATGIITSHSTSVVRRMQRVEQIRHFRQEVNSTDRYSIVNQVLLPSEKAEDDYKYINQAILAHPELYFAKLVILGEGDSEEIVIPKLAEALGFDLDPSFVSFVKLGGRHVNHMWRLLSDLNIPFLTLVDMDLGRSGAGPLRIKYIIDELEKIDRPFAFPEGVSTQKLQEKQLTYRQLNEMAILLEEYGVFYSFPLDLDMAMIFAYPDYYDASNAQDSDREVLDRAVLGENYDDYDDNGVEIYSDEELKKYRYLFCTKSKVASHYKAIADLLELEVDDVVTECPDFLKRLINKSSNLLSESKENE